MNNNIVRYNPDDTNNDINPLFKAVKKLDK